MKARRGSEKRLHLLYFTTLLLIITIIPSISSDDYSPSYDYSAYTECKKYPEAPLYNGGILNDFGRETTQAYDQNDFNTFTTWVESPAFILDNVTGSTHYCFSSWVTVTGTESAQITAKLLSNNSRKCIGTVSAKTGCWSFLKGGFTSDQSPNSSSPIILFQASDKSDIKISVSSPSLQPFTEQQWEMHQQDAIRTGRRRGVTIHVSDSQGNRVPGAFVAVKQIAKDFPFGSAISKTIIGNKPYQKWFVDRFNGAVFENELKWYVTESKQGQLNYTLADQMLDFVRSNQMLVRGHNIFWEDPVYTPDWVRNLTANDLRLAVKNRIHSLMSKYKGEFVNWDVSNEMLHFNFYEQRLGKNESIKFFRAAQRADPRATLFMNEFNVVETCSDPNSTVDKYIERLVELKQGGAALEGIGLEGHFTKPNIPYMRAVLDKLATLQLPIWLTEVDISSTLSHQTQAVYLEEVLREGFSHPAVRGIMLWTALDAKGCYQMCLTDSDLNNLPAGDVVDKLVKEWETEGVGGQTDTHGTYSFDGFLGEYELNVMYLNQSVISTFALSKGDETCHVSIQLSGLTLADD